MPESKPNMKTAANQMGEEGKREKEERLGKNLSDNSMLWRGRGLETNCL